MISWRDMHLCETSSSQNQRWKMRGNTPCNTDGHLRASKHRYLCHLQRWKWSEVAQSCLTLQDPMDCSLPGSSVHGIFHARILEWVAISFSRGTSWPRDWTPISHIVGRRFTFWATREATREMPKQHIK